MLRTKRPESFDSEVSRMIRSREVIKQLFDKGEIILEGKNISTEYVKRKFNWKKFRFEPEKFLVREVLIYADPKARFPIFDWNEYIFYTESEMNQHLLIEKLQQ